MKIVQVKEIATQIRGVSYSKGDAISNKIEGYLPLIRANNIVDGVLTNDDLLYVSGSIVQEKQIIKAGDIVIAASSGSINIVGKAAYSPENLYSTFGAFCKLIRPNTKHVLPAYLNFYFQSNAYRTKISSLAQGANINNLKNEHIDELEIPLPPLPEQKRIAEILDKADALCLKNKQLLAAYDELLQATFLDMFGDPVKNPKGWDCKRISDIGTSRLGKMLDRKTIVGENLKPYLRNSNVSWFEFKLDDLLEMDFNEKDKIEFSLKNGDVLMCEGGEIGRCAIWRDNLKECYFQKAIHRIRLNDKYALPEFFVFMFWLYTKKGGLNKFLGAATILHLTGVNLKKIELPIPPIHLQNQFAQIVENIEAQKTLVKQSLQESEDLFNGLVQKAFSGEM